MPPDQTGQPYPEDLRPQFVEVPSARLYTALSAPIGANPSKAVLICGSICHEHERSFRALRLLASTLAGRGIPAMRYDYRGQANSTGEEEIDIDQWADDTLVVIESLQHRARVDEVSLIGFRFGAIIAQALKQRTKIHATAWHPPEAGSAFVADLESQHHSETQGFGRDPSAYDSTILGYALSESSRQILHGTQIDRGGFDDVLPRAGEPSGAGAFWQSGDEGLVPSGDITELTCRIARGDLP